MKLNQIISLLSIVFVSTSAHAVLDVCELGRVAFEPGTTVSQSAIENYKVKLNEECAVFKKALEVRNESRDLGIKLEDIYGFQALRYIDRNAYNIGKSKDLPVEYIFQVRREDANLPLAQRSNLVWRNWSKGISQLEKTVSDIEQGVKIDLSYIQKIHIGFFSEDESGDMGNVVNPGELKTGRYATVAFDIHSQSDLERISAAAKIINDTFADMGLRPQMVAEQDYVNNIIDVRDGKLYPAAPYAVKTHYENLVKFLNVMLDQARQNKHMIWKDRVFTPNELAYFIQQYIVQIHGFHDGNGRTSRFWQDTILALFDFPAGDTGDLEINDINSTKDEYYKDAISKSYNSLLNVQKCLTKVYPKLLPNNWKESGYSIRSVDAGKIPYDCRLLN